MNHRIRVSNVEISVVFRDFFLLLPEVKKLSCFERHRKRIYCSLRYMHLGHACAYLMLDRSRPYTNSEHRQINVPDNCLLYVQLNLCATFFQIIGKSMSYSIITWDNDVHANCLGFAIWLIIDSSSYNPYN